MSNESDLITQVGRLTAASAPAGWTQIWLTSEIKDDWGKSEFDWESKSSERTWYEPSGEDQYKIFKLLQELRRLMAERPPHQKWSRVVFTVEASGRFQTDFRYEQ